MLQHLIAAGWVQDRGRASIRRAPSLALVKLLLLPALGVGRNGPVCGPSFTLPVSPGLWKVSLAHWTLLSSPNAVYIQQCCGQNWWQDLSLEASLLDPAGGGGRWWWWCRCFLLHLDDSDWGYGLGSGRSPAEMYVPVVRLLLQPVSSLLLMEAGKGIAWHRWVSGQLCICPGQVLLHFQFTPWVQIHLWRYVLHSWCQQSVARIIQP